MLHRAKKKVITPANYIRRVDIALNLFTKKIFRTAYLKRSKRCSSGELLHTLIMSVLSCNTQQSARKEITTFYFYINQSPNFCYLTCAVTEWSEPIWIRVKTLWQILPQHQSSYLKGTCINWNSLFQTQIYKLFYYVLVCNNYYWVKLGLKGDFSWCRF